MVQSAGSQSLCSVFTKPIIGSLLAVLEKQAAHLHPMHLATGLEDVAHLKPGSLCQLGTQRLHDLVVHPARHCSILKHAVYG